MPVVCPAGIGFGTKIREVLGLSPTSALYIAQGEQVQLYKLKYQLKGIWIVKQNHTFHSS